MIKDKLTNINKYKINASFEIFKNHLNDIKDFSEIPKPFKVIQLEYKTHSDNVWFIIGRPFVIIS